MPEEIKIVEVGPRDGLQNEAKSLSVEDRILLVQKLETTGLKFLEGGSFVSPKAIPQMQDSDKVFAGLKNSKADLSFLVPNQKGLDLAIAAGVKSIAIFSATSDSFTKKNINKSVDESLNEFESVSTIALKSGMRIRGYISTVFGCPYEGDQPIERATTIVDRLFAMGCDEVSIGDTIGVAHPSQVEKVFKALIKKFGEKKLAGHFHDTRGMALVNIKTALDMGIRTFDSSVGGLGGCPYAKGSSGNVATEEVCLLMEGLGFKTGVSVVQLLETAQWVEAKIGRLLKSRLYLSKPEKLLFKS